MLNKFRAASSATVITHSPPDHRSSKRVVDHQLANDPQGLQPGRRKVRKFNTFRVEIMPRSINVEEVVGQ